MKILPYVSLFLIILIGFKSHGQYNFKNLSVGDGLAQSQVYCLLEDSRGCVWMGTQGGGVSCYNGNEFSNYNLSDGLRSNFVNSIVEDSQGNIWIGTSKGLNQFDGRTLLSFDDSLNLAIDDLAIDNKGILWCATEKGLYFCDSLSLKEYNSPNDGVRYPIYDILIDSRNEKWLATDNGIVHIGDSVNILSVEDGLKSRLVNNLEEDSSGRIWISTYGAGVMIYDRERFRSVAELNEIIAFDFLEKDGTMWIGSMKNGLISYDLTTDRIGFLTTESGLPNNQIRCLECDSWNNLWVGTSGGGVSNYSGQQFQYFSRENGMPGRQVYSFIGDQESGFWMGNSDLGLYRFFPDSSDQYRQIVDVPNTKVKALHQDKLGRVWAGTSGMGIYVVEGDTTWEIGQDHGLNSSWIRAFEEAKNGDLYVGTAGGGINLIQFKDSTNYEIEIFNKQKDLVGLRITDLKLDHLDRLWYSTQSNGIGVILQDGNVITFKTDDGLHSNSIRSLELDSIGWLWIGSTDNGISRMNLNAEVLEFDHLDTELLKTSKNIYFIQFDLLNNLWYGTESGVNHVLLDTTRNVLDWTRYGKEEGFFGIETCTNASYLDKNFNLWFGTIDGLNKTHHSFKVENERAPKLRFTDISLFYKSLDQTHLKNYLNPWGGITDTLILTYQQNHLSFDFVGINLPNPDKVNYQWMLKGSEEEWSPLSSKNSISYSNLKPGMYTFMVRSCNEDGICNEEAEKVHFKILAPFWQKTGNQIAFVIIFIAILSGILYWRIKEIKARAMAKTDRVNLEKNLIELEQKALRLQMNPHFIFNSLNSIQGLIAKDDSKSARLYLSRFSRLMRQTLENSREALVSVEDEVEALKNYLDLEKFTHNSCFDYEILMEDEALHFLMPPLLVQPFVENSILHGVLPKKDNGKITIDFSKKNGDLMIEIRDNGIGRQAAEEAKSLKSKYHKSAGMEVTSERVEALGKNSKIEIIDLKDEDGIPQGTSVRIYLPIIE